MKTFEVEIEFTHVDAEDEEAVDKFFEGLRVSGSNPLVIATRGGGPVEFVANVSAETFRDAVGVLIAAVGSVWGQAHVVRVVPPCGEDLIPGVTYASASEIAEINALFVEDDGLTEVAW